MGVILQMMDEDDNMVGGCVEHIPPTAEDLAAAAALIRSGKWDVFTPREHHDSFVKYSNMTVNGDTFNSSGYSGRITEEELEKLARKAKNPFGGMGLSKYHSMNARHLCFTLENVVYNGAISTAEGFHIDRDTGLRLPAVGNAKWYCISVLQSEPKPVYQAGLILTMKQGSVWNVPKTCYLSSLTVDKTSRIAGRVYVDGSYVVPKAGVTYKGYITVQPGI
jgi:hypothetical protein